MNTNETELLAELLVMRIKTIDAVTSPLARKNYDAYWQFKKEKAIGPEDGIVEIIDAWRLEARKPKSENELSIVTLLRDRRKVKELDRLDLETIITTMRAMANNLELSLSDLREGKDFGTKYNRPEHDAHAELQNTNSETAYHLFVENDCACRSADWVVKGDEWCSDENRAKCEVCNRYCAAYEFVDRMTQTICDAFDGTFAKREFTPRTPC